MNPKPPQSESILEELKYKVLEHPITKWTLYIGSGVIALIILSRILAVFTATIFAFKQLKQAIQH